MWITTIPSELQRLLYPTRPGETWRFAGFSDSAHARFLAKTFRRPGAEQQRRWPHSGRPTALNTATHCVMLSSIAAGHRAYGLVAGVPVSLYGSEGWGFESLRAHLRARYAKSLVAMLSGVAAPRVPGAIPITIPIATGIRTSYRDRASVTSRSKRGTGSLRERSSGARRLLAAGQGRRVGAGSVPGPACLRGSRPALVRRRAVAVASLPRGGLRVPGGELAALRLSDLDGRVLTVIRPGHDLVRARLHP